MKKLLLNVVMISAVLAVREAAAQKLITQENHGVALMGKFDFDGAIAVFQQILQAHPHDATAAVNLAIATLNRQREGDSAAALVILDKLLAEHPDEIRAHYCRGILLLNAGDPQKALVEFQTVAAKDPDDAYAAYWVGQSLASLRKPSDALPQFLRAAQLKPTLRSAYYGAFQALQRLGRVDEAKQQFARFQDLKDNPQAQLVEFKYTRMGPKAEAFVPESLAAATEPSLPPGPDFADPQAIHLTDPSGITWGSIADTDRPSITAADIDGDGKLDLFITGGSLRVDGEPRIAVLLQRDKGAWKLARDHPLAKVDHVNAALWGDFDNDGLTDVYLCRSTGGNELWRQTKSGEWEDVTKQAGAGGPGGDTIDGAFVDADHDGDLDLFLIRSDGANVLLNNDGNGRFRDISAQAGIAGDGAGAAGLIVNDLNHDGAVDFIVLKKTPPHEVYLNDLRWHFHKGGPEWREFVNAPADAGVAADADADGRPELYTLHAPADLKAWNLRNGAWQSTSINHSGKDLRPPIAFADTDGTGRLKLLFGANGVESVDIGSNTFANLHNEAAMKAFALVCLDAQKGPSLVGLPGESAPIICPPGAGRLDFAAIRLSGKNRESDQMRSNASGVGVKLAVRVGDHWTATDTYRGSSGPGQSDQPLCVGLRGASAADFIRLTWPDALQQTEMSITPGFHRIDETQRQTSSCPVIFAWDGKHYAFVTDCLGVGGIGFALGPDQFAPERPNESVLLPDKLLQPRDGAYALKLAEPMEEACYLDAAALASYDLPPGWSVTVDERMATGDPQPTSRPRFYRRMILPTSVTNDRGEDVTQALRRVDKITADPGPIDPRFIGHLIREHVLTLTFDQPIDGASGQPTLIADGWIEYPYSQTMFAAWQAGASYDAPTIEAEGSDDSWVSILPHFGYPAGMPREMSVPLPIDKLPRDCRRIRIRTTMEIYWDRLALAFCEPCPDAVRRVLPLKNATVAASGFAKRTTGPQRRPIYDDDRRTPLWDTHHQDGFYTSLGVATPLVQTIDDAVCIFGPGEEVQFDFSADETRLRDGWTRRYVLELSGWCKDRDLYTKDGNTIAPLPMRDGAKSTAARDALLAHFNTRWMSGGN